MNHSRNSATLRESRSRTPRSTLPRPIATVVGRGWLVATVGVVVAGAVVSGAQFRDAFGDEQRVASQPALRIEPLVERLVEYRVSGPAATPIRLSYFDETGVLREVDTALPWRVSFSTTRLTMPAGVTVASIADSVTCAIVVDGVVVRESTGTGTHAVTSCQAETL